MALPLTAARNRNALTYAPGMSARNYLDAGIADYGGSVAPGGTAPGGGGGFAPAPDTGGGVTFTPTPAAGGGGGGMGGAGSLLGSVAGALLDPRVWNTASGLFGGGASAAGAGWSGGLGNAAGELGSAGQLGGIGPGDASLLGELMPGAGGGVAGAGLYPAIEAATDLGSIASTAAADYGLIGGVDVAGGLGAEAGLAGGELAAEGAGALAGEGIGAAGLGAFGIALLPAMIGYAMRPDTSYRGGRVDIGAGPDGRATILGASGKDWDPALAQGRVGQDIAALNAFMARNNLSLRPDFRWGQETSQAQGDWQEGPLVLNNIFDRVGFLAGDAFTSSDPNVQARLGQNYAGWNDFSAAFGGGVPGAVGHGEGYRLDAADVAQRFNDGLLPLFGGTAPANWGDRWQDLAARTAARTAGMSNSTGQGDIDPRADWYGLPRGFLEMFDGGRDPRTLPTALTGDQYGAMLRGDIGGGALFDQLYGGPAAAPAPNALAAVAPEPWTQATA
jgi:hypothetical protein